MKAWKARKVWKTWKPGRLGDNYKGFDIVGLKVVEVKLVWLGLLDFNSGGVMVNSALPGLLECASSCMARITTEPVACYRGAHNTLKNGKAFF